MQHAGQTDVVDKFAASGEKTRILGPQHARADGFSAQPVLLTFFIVGLKRFTRNRNSLYRKEESRLEDAMAVDALDKPGGTLLCGDAVAIGADGLAVLVGGLCKDCSNQTFPRAPVCCVCMSEAIEPAPMPRTGTLYAFSTVHVAAKKWNKPMRIGYVDLANGARVFTHLEGDLTIGDSVEVALGVVGEDENGAIESFVFKRGAS
jgi:uncharacterized OB-fold protein